MSYRRGFSFAEVMFAVVILGIGFVMVAAVFPVAVEQTRSTADEATASQLARDVSKLISTYVKADDFSDTTEIGITQAFASKALLWPQISGGLISATDARYACVPYYCILQDGTVRITLQIVRRWMHDTYTQTDLSGDGDLTPRGISINRVVPSADGSDVIEIGKDDAGMYKSVAPGSFIVITNLGDGTSGQTFQIASKKSETDNSITWTLAITTMLLPGESYDSNNGTISGAVIGSDYANPTNATAGYVGPAQDIAVYTTFIRPQ